MRDRNRQEERPPICPVCGVTMVPAALSADASREGEWVCLECEETSGVPGPDDAQALEGEELVDR